MLIKFVSQASGSILMRGVDALPVLKAAGKQFDGGELPERGVFTVQQLDDAIDNLQAAMAAAAEPDDELETDPTIDQLNIEQAVGFKQRAFPLFDMLNHAKEAGVDIMWEPADSPW